MATGVNTIVSFLSATSRSVTLRLDNEFATETGCVIIFTDNTLSTEVTRSETISLYQQSMDITISGLSPGTSYCATFQNDMYMFGNIETFSTLSATEAKLYASASQVKQLYCPTGGLVVSLNILDDEYTLVPTITDSDKFISAISSLGLAPKDVAKVIVKCDDNIMPVPGEPTVPDVPDVPTPE